MHFNFAVTESRNHEVTESKKDLAKSSIAPPFQSGAIKMEMEPAEIFTQHAVCYG